MAIYSLNLKSIGRSTHAAGTAGAHLLYIARPDAKPELAAAHMPIDPQEARSWMNRAEGDDRKNARVIDKVRLALPRELSPEQRMQLVQDFARDLTKDRVPWFAAIHAAGEDAHNPHCHLVIRDRDIGTGKRVLRLSDSARDREKAGLDPKAVEWVRIRWETQANRALEAAGFSVRIDRRSLEDQGIDREATIHIGPQAQHVENFVQRPQSKIVEKGNGRSIDYPQIDAGRTRQERHSEIVDFNIEKAARSPDFRTRETAKFEREQVAKDRALERQLLAQTRQRTVEARAARAHLRADLQEARDQHQLEQQHARHVLRQSWTQNRSKLTTQHHTEKDDLAKQQGRLTARIMRIVDITGQTRRTQNEAVIALQDRQKADRGELVRQHQAARQAHAATLKARYDDRRDGIRDQYRPTLRVLAEQHQQAERDADQKRQARAAERERAEARFEQVLRQTEKIMQEREQRNKTQTRAPRI